MVRLFTICTLALLFVSPLQAGDWPAAELHAGPSVLRVEKQDLLGGQIGLAVNRWEYFGFVGSFGYHQGNQKTFRFGPLAEPPGRCDDDNGHASDQDNDNDNACPPRPPLFVTTGIGDVYTYMGGMRLRKSAGRFVVFVQGQAGGVHVSDKYGLALAAGGGAQVGITQRFAVEARVEYLPLRIAGEWATDNVQGTVGIVVRFGPWWGGYRKP